MLKEEKIVTMQAELTALKGQFALGPKLKAAFGDKDGDKKDPSNPKEDKSGKTKNKKGTANKRKQKEAKKWQRVPPKEGKSHEKKVKDRTFYWCKHHMCWGGHKDKDCKKSMERRAQQNEGSTTHTASAASATTGTISLPTCIVTWRTNDSSDRHGLGGPHTGYYPWPRLPSTMHSTR